MAPPLLLSHAAKFSAPHSTVASLAAFVKLGAVASSTVYVADVVVSFPQASVAINTTVALPPLPQVPLKPLALFVHVTVPQSSVAVAPPLLLSHAAKSSAPHSTVASLAAFVKLGGVASSIVYVAEVVVAFPHSSVAVNTTVALPELPHKLLKPLALLVQVIAPPQTSLTLAPPLLLSQVLKSSVPHSAVSSLAAVERLGGCVSSTE